jgi:TolB-like protein/Flp pilus assembly protein TadD
VRRQLEKILVHELFARSERMARFLRFTVEETLEGRGGDLKEYSIGVEVFDRKRAYDPRVDPIVRVEARRLRSKLKAFYDGDGKADPVVIEYATGTYAPRFHLPEAGRASQLATIRVQEPGVLQEADATTTAVLPFVNLSPNPESEYFSDGLTEELIHALTKVPGLRVVAWTSAAQLRNRQQDISAVRKELRVATVLTGSVRIGGTGLRVRAQLIDTETGVYLWSETYDRQMQDVFAIQEEIAIAIVRTLRLQLAPDREPAVAGRARTSITAYNWYLKGRYAWRLRTTEGLRESVACFEAAIAADPSSALAHAGLADAYSLLVEYGHQFPTEGVPLARMAAERAIALDPELAEPHASLAFIRGTYEWDWTQAERGYRLALELNPGYATAHHWLGIDHLALLGRFEEAAEEMRIAVELDPLSGIMLEGRGYLRMLMRDYEGAVEGFSDIFRVDPSFYKAFSSLGRAYALLGRYREAIASLSEARARAGELPSILGALGQVYALAGEERQARELLGRLEQLAKTRFVPSTCLALVHLGLGDKGQALDWLERACERKEPSITVLRVHPLYDPLRQEPRFRTLLHRVFPESA